LNDVRLTDVLFFYLSVFFELFNRSKPVVRVKSKLSFSSALNKQVNLEEKGCTLRDLTAVTCLPLSLCMEYDGEGADDVIGEYLIETSFIGMTIMMMVVVKACMLPEKKIFQVK
jgi:hypothetical protein